MYGRRRCGKSRLIQEATRDLITVYYVGDERRASLQRQSLARAVAEHVPGFDQVSYPDWEPLLQRWAEAAPAGAVLVLDEFPALAQEAPELPSLLQKMIDAPRRRPFSTVFCGSSQRMMYGLVLDAAAPLFGRAREIIRVQPLGAGWLQDALHLKTARAMLDAYAVWGGIPRYWELALDFSDTASAMRSLVLDPLGVLHHEPDRLLRDDMKDLTQAGSILALIGRGCHRMTEIAGRLEMPATAMSRPLAKLVELGLIRRDIPFGVIERDSKRSLYQIADPFLRFWFRFVEPNRSRLEARQLDAVAAGVRRDWSTYLSEAWEDLARSSVPRLRIAGRSWRPAGRWWGPGTDRQPLELDVVALAENGEDLLIGEARLHARGRSAARAAAELAQKANRLPLAGSRRVTRCLWTVDPPDQPPEETVLVTGAELFASLRG